MPQQEAKAAAFRNLHKGPDVLVLPNIWDVASARIIEESGFKAVATSSAGVAFALGYPDGQVIPRDEMLAAIARIAKAVKVPVTADVESGYGSKPEDAARTARSVIDAGAVGLNLEDTVRDSPALVDLALQLEKIRAVREIASRVRIPLVLNARTDVYLLQIGEPAKRYDETVRRLAVYRDAGADCVFAPGLQDALIIGRLVADLKCRVNILVGPGSPSVPELGKLGVARVSLGSSAMRATVGYLCRIAEELRTSGTYIALEDAPTHAEMNQMMSRGRR
ncbi:MAG TPA: isocitrate lyase/phosphoenolpyruvate mutase family protein [Candidatus Sulfotelmatobacter sp.]